VAAVKVSSKAHYGLRAMTELAQAHGRGPLALSEIARAEHLSLGYLEQLMAALRRAGLVEATRGASGGYRLTREPAAITVGQIYRALEGPIGPVECVEDGYIAGSCDREPACASRGIWRRVRASIEQVLDSTTLADLCVEPQLAFIGLDEIGLGSRKAMCTTK
jgi:Rrf2 family transcriptional regulator, cysteine metabolism repressor